MKRQRFKLSRPRLQHSTARDSAATAKIHDVPAPWPPLSQSQFAQYGIPLPPDPLSESFVVKREITGRRPIVACRGICCQEPLAQPAQNGEIRRGPMFHGIVKLLVCKKFLLAQQLGQPLVADSVKLQQLMQLSS